MNNKEIIGKISKDIAITHSILEYEEKVIVLYSDRYTHIERHKNEFIDEESYNNALNSLEKIISNPDYVYVDLRKNGLEFYKKIDENVCVAIRIDNRSNELKIKSMYPVTQSKIDNRKRLK